MNENRRIEDKQGKSVAGYGRWGQLGRQVRTGEKGVKILAPVVYRRKGTEMVHHCRSSVTF